MEKPEIVTFNLHIQKGVSLEDAVNALESTIKGVSILYSNAVFVRCQAPTPAYELFSGTNLIKKVCEYTNTFPFTTKVQHDYYTTDEEPEVCETLKPYFKNVSTVGAHFHTGDSL